MPDNPADFNAFIAAIDRLVTTRISQAIAPNGNESPARGAPPEVSVDALSRSITPFTYNPESNLTFENWYQRYKSTFLEDGKNLDEAARVRLLLRRLDHQAYTRYANIIRPRDPATLKFDETVTRLTKLYGRGESLFSLRRQCLQHVMNETDDWATHGGIVNALCEDFRINECKGDHFKALIFCTSIQSDKHVFVREQLLTKLETEPAEKINVEYLIDEARRLSNVKKDARLDMAPVNVNAVRKEAPAKKERPPRPCYLCGAMHFVKDCTYTNSKCIDCGQIGHRGGYCPPPPKEGTSQNTGSRKKNNKWKKKKPSATTNVISSSRRKSRRYLSPLINGHRVDFQLDCGADVSVITKATWERLGKPNLSPISLNVKDAQANSLTIMGEFDARVSFRGNDIRHGCIVSSSTKDNLFGIDLIEAFGLWDEPPSAYCNMVHKEIDTAAAVKELQSTFPKVFSANEIGMCTKAVAKIHLKADAVPVFRPKRPVPFHVLPEIDEELERLQASGIITPVEYSAWAAPIVVARKPNGSVRFCGDYSTGLNDAVETNSYPVPDPDSLFTQMANKSVYSHIDLSDAYLQIPVDKESSQLLTINTPRGLFNVNRLPPGIRIASGAFQETVDTMLHGIPGVVSYFDDICIASENKEEHLATLKKVFQRLEEYSFKVRLEKCKFFADSIKFLGVIVDKDGLHPDPEKTEAIRRMPAPKNIQELRSFLGALQFWGKFVPKMSELRTPLDRLLKKGARWRWNKPCQDAFKKFKDILASELLLTHYDPKMPILIASDASSYAIGTVAYHEYPDGSRKAFYYASRRLSDTEGRYSQIEKEALGIIFAVKKYHRFIFGRQFTLLTDHKPLLSIFGSKKGIPVHTANRLQRWALTLLGYNFDIRYMSTDSFGHADVLSRLISSQQRITDEVIIAQLHLEETFDDLVMQEALSGVPVDFNMVRKATKSSAALQEVTNYIVGGWPKSLKAIKSTEAAKLHKVRDSLSLIKDVIFYNERLLVPEQFRAKILGQLHHTHPGIVRMKALARSYVYWPGMDADIEAKVRNCVNCATAERSPVKTHLASWPLSTYTWERIHIDYAKYKGQNFFLVVDSFSKWPEIIKTSSTTTAATIEMLEEIFSHLGYPEYIVSDNGPQFTNPEFAKFCGKYGIKHIKTNPYSPASNGQCERLVGTFKQSMEKQNPTGSLDKALREFLANYRVTPNDNAPGGKSPSELMFTRKTRTIFDLLKYKPEEPIRRNEKMEEQYNRRHGTKARAFLKGEEVYAMKFAKSGKFTWVPGNIIERRGSVSYNVRLVSGLIIRSHANQVKHRYTENSPNITLADPPLFTPATVVPSLPTPQTPERPPIYSVSSGISTPVSSHTPIASGSSSGNVLEDIVELPDSDEYESPELLESESPRTPDDSDTSYVPPGRPAPGTPIYRRMRTRNRSSRRSRLSDRFDQDPSPPSGGGRC